MKQYRLVSVWDCSAVMVFVNVPDVVCETLAVPTLGDTDGLALFEVVAVVDVVDVGVLEPVPSVDVAVREALPVAVRETETDSVVLGREMVSEAVVTMVDVAVKTSVSVPVISREVVGLREGVVVEVMDPMDVDKVVSGVVVAVGCEWDNVAVGVDGIVAVVVGDW